MGNARDDTSPWGRWLAEALELRAGKHRFQPARVEHLGGKEQDQDQEGPGKRKSESPHVTGLWTPSDGGIGF